MFGSSSSERTLGVFRPFVCWSDPRTAPRCTLGLRARVPSQRLEGFGVFRELGAALKPSIKFWSTASGRLQRDVKEGLGGLYGRTWRSPTTIPARLHNAGAGCAVSSLHGPPIFMVSGKCVHRVERLLLFEHCCRHERTPQALGWHAVHMKGERVLGGNSLDAGNCVCSTLSGCMKEWVGKCVGVR